MAEKTNTKSKKKKEPRPDLTLRTLLMYSVDILITLIIILFIVQAFSYSFKLGYNIISDSAKSPGSTAYKTVTIYSDASSTEIAEALYDAEIIKDKYVMIGKLKIGSYSSKIVSGTYKLSPSMTYNEIINKICGIKEDSSESTD